MPDKTFEHVIRFSEVQTDAGLTIWLPLVRVTLIRLDGTRVSLPLLVDTGASVTVLRHDLYPLFGVPSWDSGQPEGFATAGGSARAYRYRATLELFGRSVECPVYLMELLPNPSYMGLFGREQIFQEFGFGFWEKTHELYVTLNP